MENKQKSLFKVVILGDSNVGKTSLVRNYVENCFSEHYKGTVGADVIPKTLVLEGRKITMQIWDTSGTERFESLCPFFYRGADCCILVFDMTDERTLPRLNYWHEEFLLIANPDNPETFPFVVLGNKLDLENREISRSKAEMWCKRKHDIPYFETSAKESTNVDLAFRTLAENTLALEDNSVINEDIPDTIVLPSNWNCRDKKKSNCLCN